jgi:hypothetical protein
MGRCGKTGGVTFTAECTGETQRVLLKGLTAKDAKGKEKKRGDIA